ncbi:MAG TPA: hypothetical protein VF329_11320 [Gammaproteobacteria bacterium]
MHEAAEGLAASREYRGIVAANLAPVFVGCDRLDDLNTRRAGADHADPLAGKIDVVMRPAGRVVVLSLERVDAVDVGQLVGGQRADRGDQVTRPRALAAVGLDEPRVVPRVVPRGDDLRLEANVAQKIELLGRVVQVREHLGLRGESLAPAPFLEELRRERIAVRVAFRVESGARVAVPVPNAADSARALVRLHGEPELAESM